MSDPNQPEREDKASVEVRQTAEYTAGDEFLEEELDGDRTNTLNFTTELVREGGDWKVDAASPGN